MTRASEGEPIGQSLISSVTKLPELQDVTQDYAELALDALVDSGIADEIPIVKTVRALARGVTGLHEALLIRKLAAMLQGLGNFTHEEAMTFREKLRTDEQIEDFGERVIGIVDRIEMQRKLGLSVSCCGNTSAGGVTGLRTSAQLRWLTGH